jgi:hypothetical protein
LDKSGTVELKQRKTVAVISVHGVGDQKPFETARRIGDLLQQLSIAQPAAGQEIPPTQEPPPCAGPGPESPRYYPFHEEKIRISVNPVVVRGVEPSSQAMAASKPSTLGPFNAFVKAELRKSRPAWRTTTAMHKQHPANYDVFIEFMKRQLFCYGGDRPEDTYETIRLEGTRADSSSGVGEDVHIYELYWADLSRLKAGIFSIFTELYQLLFHLSLLGVHAINAASLDHPEEKSWHWLRRFQSWASTILTVPIPVFNLVMLGLLVVVLGLAALQSVSLENQFGAIVVIVTACLIAGTGRVLWLAMRKHVIDRGPWIAAFVAWIVAASAFIVYVRYYRKIIPEQYLLSILEGVLLFVVAAGLIFLLLRVYNRRRPGVLKWGLILSAVALLAAVPTFWELHSQLKIFHLATTAPQFWVREFEVVYAATTLSWFLFFVLGIVNCILGFLAVMGTSGEKRDLAVRSRWTGWLMLALPSFTFLVVTVIGWGLLAKATEKIIPTDPYYPLFHRWIDASCPRELATAFLTGPVEIMLPVALFFAGLAALPAIWGMAPVVWAEVFPPPAYKALRNDKSVPLGQWLSLAYRGALLVSGCVLILLMTAFLPAGVVLRLLHIPFTIPGAHDLGLLSGALFTWLFLARGSLKKLALGFRPALDLLLDVDNWLREHPLNSNPKARICGRYVSLLRYISNWKNITNPNGYDKIVVIAHSQGTVITADLLRFLHSKIDAGSPKRWIDLDPQLKKLAHPPIDFTPDSRGLPLTLFTMGCPLRQLYGLRFPYLYQWARHQNTAPMPKWVHNDLAIFSPLPEPNPGDLGVRQWVNAFRSGDYVGRNLWRTDACSYLWFGDALVQLGPPPKENYTTDKHSRIEFCIGAGAHTHYWDETAPMIAQELDRLI